MFGPQCSKHISMNWRRYKKLSPAKSMVWKDWITMKGLRLKELDLYSLERRRDRYFIIYGWQQLEGLKENVLRLKSSWIGTSRRIVSKRIPYQVEGRR